MTSVQIITLLFYPFDLQMVKEREEELITVENEHRVDSVQERFPNDNLQLQEKDRVRHG